MELFGIFAFGNATLTICIMIVKDKGESCDQQLFSENFGIIFKGSKNVLFRLAN